MKQGIFDRMPLARRPAVADDMSLAARSPLLGRPVVRAARYKVRSPLEEVVSLAETIRLTTTAKAAGCAAKLDPSILESC